MEGVRKLHRLGMSSARSVNGPKKFPSKQSTCSDPATCSDDAESENTSKSTISSRSGALFPLDRIADARVLVSVNVDIRSPHAMMVVAAVPEQFF